MKKEISFLSCDFLIRVCGNLKKTHMNGGRRGEKGTKKVIMHVEVKSFEIDKTKTKKKKKNVLEKNMELFQEKRRKPLEEENTYIKAPRVTLLTVFR